MPLAIPAKGDLSWEYPILIPTLTDAVRGMLAIWSAQGAHSNSGGVWAIRFFLDEHRRLRDRALFDLAIDSKLRGGDIVKMKIGDIVSGGVIRNRATVMQQKTKRPVQFEIMTEARQTLLTWLKCRGRLA
jgi:integrase